MVRGRVSFVGGGNSKRVVGVAAIGEEVNSKSGTQTVRLTGTVDLLYSSESIGLAAECLSMMAVMSWREVGNP